jgi:ribosomal protein L40E
MLIGFIILIAFLWYHNKTNHKTCPHCKADNQPKEATRCQYCQGSI